MPQEEGAGAQLPAKIMHTRVCGREQGWCTWETSLEVKRMRRLRSSILATALQVSRRTVSMPFASNTPAACFGVSCMMPT